MSNMKYNLFCGYILCNIVSFFGEVDAIFCSTSPCLHLYIVFYIVILYYKKFTDCRSTVIVLILRKHGLSIRNIQDIQIRSFTSKKVVHFSEKWRNDAKTIYIRHKFILYLSCRTKNNRPEAFAWSTTSGNRGTEQKCARSTPPDICCCPCCCWCYASWCRCHASRCSCSL